jgi:hypothetical protein
MGMAWSYLIYHICPRGLRYNKSWYCHRIPIHKIIRAIKYHPTSYCTQRKFVKLVFDSNLYYQDGIYRTPTV